MSVFVYVCLLDCRSDCVFRCLTLSAGQCDWYSDSMCLLKWMHTLWLRVTCVCRPCCIGCAVFWWPWETTCFVLLSLCLSLFAYVSVCVCGSVCECVCPQDRAVTEVNGAVSVCNVILTVSLAQTKHRGTVVEIKLGLFYCLWESPQWSNL